LSKLPNNLYKYRLYCEGAILPILTELHEVSLVWNAILSARKQADPVFKCWVCESNYYLLHCIDPSKILLVAEWVGGGNVVQPNKEERIAAENKQKATSQNGRVQLGQQANKLSPKKKG